MRLPPLRLAPLLVGLLFATVALAGQVGYRPVSLEDLATTSAAIVRVTVGDPAHAMVDVPIRAGDKDCGAYAMAKHRLRVTEVVYRRPGVPKVGGAIDAWWANGRSLKELSERACEDGTRKSPIYAVYKEGEGDLTPGRDVLLFLTHHEGWGWEVAAVTAWASLDAKPRILEALGAPK